MKSGLWFIFHQKEWGEKGTSVPEDTDMVVEFCFLPATFFGFNSTVHVHHMALGIDNNMQQSSSLDLGTSMASLRPFVSRRPENWRLLIRQDDNCTMQRHLRVTSMGCMGSCWHQTSLEISPSPLHNDVIPISPSPRDSRATNATAAAGFESGLCKCHKENAVAIMIGGD